MCGEDIGRLLQVVNRAVELPQDQRRAFVKREFASERDICRELPEIINALERLPTYPTPPLAISVNDMPGLKLEKISEAIFSKHIHKRFVMRMLFDMQTEYLAALIERRFLYALFLLTRARICMIGPLLYALWRMFVFLKT